MKTKETSNVCKECGSIGKPSKAFMNYHNIRYPLDGSIAEFETRLENCLKCVKCGHSWIPKKDKKEICNHCRKEKEGVNKKQFKEFDEVLFKKYIDKFSEEDKLKAINLLLHSSDKFKFKVEGVALDGGKYSEFDIVKVEIINSSINYEGMNNLSAKTYQTDICIVKT